MGGPRRRLARVTRLAGLAPFRQKGFRRQFPADIATSWGFEMETLVLGWYILVSTGSVVWLTAFASVQYLGTLVSPMFGVMGDRLGHRGVLCVMRGLYAVLASVIGLMALTGTMTPVAVMAVAAVAGLVRPSDMGMRNALIAASVPAPQMPAAMGISRTTADTARVMGALAGAGLVAALGIGATYAIVVLLYLISLMLTLAVPAVRRVAAAPASPLRELRDGFGHLRDTPPLMATILLAFLVNLLAYPVSGGLLPYVAREVYGVDRTVLGYLIACFAGGGLLGSLVMIGRGGVAFPGRVMLVACAIWFPLLIAFAAVTDPRKGLVLMGLAGFVQSFALVPMSVILLRCAEERFRGRVMGLRILAVYGLPLGLLVAGPLIEWLGFTRTITLYAGLGLICTGAIALHWRRHLWPAEAPANTALR
ncbi:MFS transporter [Roseomonas stagni]|uniref:MFS transporter n=1 Tax=Falsiroseomonas algicola TaxID=2716930 RepID=A0A6M1LLE6_9PROT|nr:MFS transporter [Falsiroseomonas algicola]NGM21160.1 MFS transporter [Falsiroseomonas algicola]